MIICNYKVGYRKAESGTDADILCGKKRLKKQFDFKHIEIKKEYDPSLPKVLCIATEIQQIILNLLKNAAQAMSHKTYIHDKPAIKISISQEKEYGYRGN